MILYIILCSSVKGISTESHAGALAGEDEDEHGNELSNGGLDAVGLAGLSQRSEGDSSQRHCVI